MTTIAVFAMTISHPGYCFPKLVLQAAKPKLSDIEQKAVSKTSVQESSSPTFRSRLAK